ncbi:HD domain-containing phosphohydrolase [Geodermatophilus chilensis]|jgi:response regulator RpfG family c-di-GMP phosphodiesterase|uniref:HD domain-containing phosphohydrolase n=1 Tax=Geodermatophilus chilensis TaxID=2035835 RepID=UPI000C25CE07|nr:HD domain-containing phosphohydrolase [Geodermatophilus chilensis]
MTTFSALPRPGADLAPILLVDDEVAILDGLRRQLRKRFTVHTAGSGAAALELLETTPVAVVVSDMRMPQMDGATFLAKVRASYPDVVRILLTGQADTQSAIDAVNQGQIYRFLTKPCPPDVLLDEIGSAVEYNRLVTAEKEMLRTTLRRTVEALTETLSLAQPAAFARAQRVTRTVTELAQHLQVEEPWELEITAMLAHLGTVTLPPKLLEKLEAGRPLDEDERDMERRVPAISRDLVAGIPRLESVADAIGWHRARYDGAGSVGDVPRGDDLPMSARVLRVAVDFDAGMAQRPSVHDTLQALRADGGAYDPAVLDALSSIHDAEEAEPAPKAVSIVDLSPDMVVFDDVLTTDGVLLVGRGTVVTEPLIHRLENFVSQQRVRDEVWVRG